MVAVILATENARQADSLNFSSFRPSENRVGSNGSHGNSSVARLYRPLHFGGERKDYTAATQRRRVKTAHPCSIFLFPPISLSSPLHASRRRENSNARTRKGSRARKSHGGNERDHLARDTPSPADKPSRLLPLSRPSAGPNRTKLMSRHYQQKLADCEEVATPRVYFREEGEGSGRRKDKNRVEWSYNFWPLIARSLLSRHVSSLMQLPVDGRSSDQMTHDSHLFFDQRCFYPRKLLKLYHAIVERSGKMEMQEKNICLKLLYLIFHVLKFL